MSKEHWFAQHRQATDIIVAIVTAVVLLAATPILGLPSSPTLGNLITIGMAAGLAGRRTRPVASAVAIFGLGAIQLVGIGDQLLPADVLVLVSLYSLAAYGERWASNIAMAGAVVGPMAFGVLLSRSVSGPTTVAVIGLMIAAAAAAWAFGLVRRSRVDRHETLAERARRLEIERDQQAQLAAQAERTRIAREMHDIVAHSLSVIIAQADGGRYASQGNPQAAERALTTISETGRAALADMRRILGVLRTGDGQSAELSPMPMSQDLDDLIATVRSSGVLVSLIRLGTPRRLPPGMGLALYRICQESLTNVMKHAGPGAKVVVTLQWQPTSLVLKVTDDGRGAASEPSDGVGQGLVGMRERAEMFGGSLTSGPRPGGGYQVTAQLPLPAGQGFDNEENAWTSQSR